MTLDQRAKEAVLRGLEYYKRTQNTDRQSADCGRYPYIVDCKNSTVQTWTTNWIGGVTVAMMLNGYKAFQEERYLESARIGASYLRSLQDFKPGNPRTYGVLHEETPQTPNAHPRDALTGAWAMLDFGIVANDPRYVEGAKYYADWFITVGMEKGYPYWTMQFDHDDWQPKWHGSFHSGSAAFLWRMAEVTGDARYAEAMKTVLDFYNANLLGPDGNITVIREHDTLKPLDDCADPAWAPSGWIAMHQYNDDFGALANLAAWRYTGCETYKEGAVRFLNAMKRSQRPDGGFGPAHWQDSIPNAGGVILLEMLTARRLGAIGAEFDEAIDRATEYLLAQQYLNEDSPFYGAFHGMTGTYTVDRDFCNTRASAYAIMALMARISGELPSYYVK